MKNVFVFIGILIFCSLFLFTCVGTSRNLDFVKQNAEQTFNNAGFEVVGYDGYVFGSTLIWNSNYGGAKVWYYVKLKNSNDGLVYNGYIQRWGDEIHIYNLKPIQQNVFKNN